MDIHELTLAALSIRTSLMEKKYELAAENARILQATLEDLDDGGYIVLKGSHKMLNRVIVDYHGQAVPSHIAEERYKIIPDIMFKRNDGWTLGAPEEFEDIAYEMWKGDWTHFKNRTDDEWTDIKEY